MTRRKGLLAALAAAVGFMSNRALAGDPVKGSPWTTSETTNSITIQPMDMSFDLDAFKSFTFIQGKDRITLTPTELMAALKEPDAR